jgi:hypothetical protein
MRQFHIRTDLLARGFVGLSHIHDLKTGDDSQGKRKDVEYQRESRYWITRKPLPKGFFWKAWAFAAVVGGGGTFVLFNWLTRGRG